MVDPRSIRETTCTLKAANGTPIITLGETTMELRVGDVNTEVTGLVSRHVVEPMIGIDWLTANAVIGILINQQSGLVVNHFYCMKGQLRSYGVEELSYRKMCWCQLGQRLTCLPR